MTIVAETMTEPNLRWPDEFYEPYGAIVRELAPQLEASFDSYWQSQLDRIADEGGTITQDRDEAYRRELVFAQQVIGETLRAHEQEPFSIITVMADQDFTTSLASDAGERVWRPALAPVVNYLHDTIGNNFAFGVLTTIPQRYCDTVLPDMLLNAGVQPEIIRRAVDDGLFISSKDSPVIQKLSAWARGRGDGDARDEYRNRYGFYRKLRRLLNPNAVPPEEAMRSEDWFDLKLAITHQLLEDEDATWASAGEVDHRSSNDAEFPNDEEYTTTPVSRVFVLWDDLRSVAGAIMPNHSRVRAVHISNNAMFFLPDYDDFVSKKQNV